MKFMRLWFFLIYSCSHFNSPPQLDLTSQHLWKLENQSIPKQDPDFRTFGISTEIEIWKLLPILDVAPAGAYVSVGGERSFRAASLFEGVSSLVILDVSPKGP